MNQLRFTDQVKWKLQQVMLQKYLEYYTGRGRTFFVEYHLPRTAGTAIKHAIRQQGYAGRMLTLSHGASVRDYNFRYPNLISFSVIRHPLTWYMSMYNCKVACELSERRQKIKNYAYMADNSLPDFFDDLVLYKRGVEGIRKWNKPWIKKHVGYECVKHYYPQYGYLTNLLIYYYFSSPLPDIGGDISAAIARKKIAVDHILHYENVAVELNNIIRPEGIKLDLESKIQTSVPTKGIEPSNYFNDDMVSEIKSRDRLVFELFWPQDL